MSFFEDASLVLIPSGYKASKVYSVKPTDGTGDLTFTRSLDTATRVGPDGLIEKVRTNLVLRSEELDNAAWIKTATTIVPNAVANPLNGAVTADKVTDTDSTSATRLTQQSVATIGQIHTFSGFFKKAEYNFVTLHAFGLNGAVFNLDTGVKVSQSGGVGNIIDLGGGWYRCSFAYTAVGAAAFITQSPTGAITYTGTTGSGIFAFGCQLETGDIATPYIPTTTAAVSVGMLANVPRLDYLGGGCPKMLLEPQRVNLVTFSEQINNAAWTKQAGATITANSVISPDGTQNADTLNVTTSAYSSVYNTTPYSASSGVYTQSIYAKKGTKNWLYILDLGASSAKAWFNLDTGVVGTVASGYTATIQNAGNGWYRCILTETTNRLPLYFHFGASDADNSFTPSSAGTAFIWGCQVEQGAFATSYIPTLGAAVTRGADAASKTGISSLIGQTEGTLFVEVDYSTLSGLNMFLSIRPNASNKVEIYRDSGNIFGEITASVSFAFSAAKPVGTHKIAFAYKSGSSALFIDGVLVNQNTTAFTFSATLADLFINQRSGGTFIEAANYKQALLFPTRLSNAALAELTA